MAFLTWYRGFRVFRLADGKQIMDLKLPHSPKPWFSGVLATAAESHTWFCCVMAPNWKATAYLRSATNHAIDSL